MDSSLLTSVENGDLRMSVYSSRFFLQPNDQGEMHVCLEDLTAHLSPSAPDPSCPGRYWKDIKGDLRSVIFLGISTTSFYSTLPWTVALISDSIENWNVSRGSEGKKAMLWIPPHAQCWSSYSIVDHREWAVLVPRYRDFILSALAHTEDIEEEEEELGLEEGSIFETFVTENSEKLEEHGTPLIGTKRKMGGKVCTEISKESLSVAAVLYAKSKMALSSLTHPKDGLKFKLVPVEGTWKEKEKPRTWKVGIEIEIYFSYSNTSIS